jgi:hypothetical protein
VSEDFDRLGVAVAVANRTVVDYVLHLQEITRGPLPLIVVREPVKVSPRWAALLGLEFKLSQATRVNWLEELHPCEALRSRDPGQVTP